MGTTPKYAIPYPEPGDTMASYPATSKTAAETIESTIATKGVKFVSGGAKTTDANGLYTMPHGLGAAYSQVTSWLATAVAGATGNTAVVTPLFRTVDATNVYFRVFKVDGTPYAGNVTLYIIGA